MQSDRRYCIKNASCRRLGNRVNCIGLNAIKICFHRTFFNSEYLPPPHPLLTNMPYHFIRPWFKRFTDIFSFNYAKKKIQLIVVT